jgi:hypothetical protein
MLQDAREKTIYRDRSCRCICFIFCSLETLELVVCALSQRGRGKEIHFFPFFDYVMLYTQMAIFLDLTLEIQIVRSCTWMILLV